MPREPDTKRTCAFIDGQNLFFAAKHAFGYSWPNFDPIALATAACFSQGWTLVKTHFYTGIPSADVNPFWNHFWIAKLASPTGA